jgi:hypothetical protein
MLKHHPDPDAGEIATALGGEATFDGQVIFYEDDD